LALAIEITWSSQAITDPPPTPSFFFARFGVDY
jgi:hypothetical protein